MPPNILFITSEVSPYSTTGGLSEVTAALPRALRALGAKVSVLSPFYRNTGEKTGPLSQFSQILHFPLGSRQWSANILSCTGHDQVRQFFLDIPELFDRPGVYGDNGDAGYDDNPIRFAVLSRAAVALAAQYDIPVDIIHCHDWQSALIPHYLSQLRPTESRLDHVATVLTIHNLAFQGTAPIGMESELGLHGNPRMAQLFQHGGVLNVLKGGILCADMVTTVSPTYSREICTLERGFGLDTELLARRESLMGILNGVDYSVWSPDKDIHLPVGYDAANLNGKRRCKAHLQARCGLTVKPWVPLIGVVTRMTEQKGTDLLAAALSELLRQEELQVVIVGEGTNGYQASCLELAQNYPRNVAVKIGYLHPFAHQVFAGADLFAMPSRFEPCGLSQMYAMRYGAVPVVRDTGGLHDTVEGFNPKTHRGTGFVFSETSAEALRKALTRATSLFRSDAKAWRTLMSNAMSADFSWARAAEQYLEVYSLALEKSGRSR